MTPRVVVNMGKRKPDSFVVPLLFNTENIAVSSVPPMHSFREVKKAKKSPSVDSSITANEILVDKFILSPGIPVTLLFLS